VNPLRLMTPVLSNLSWHPSARPPRPALVALALCLGASAVAAQQMPLALVEGSRYTRRTVDAQGAEGACQTLAVGSVVVAGEEMAATLTVRPCDGDAADVSETTIRCRVDDAGMVMNVVALLGPEGRDLALRVTGDALLYPGPPTQRVALDDVTLEADIERGTLGFLGGRTRIDFENRVARPSATDAPAGAYTVTEAVRLRAYVLGVRVKNDRYRAEETLLPGGGLLRQVLTSDGGSIVLARSE